MPIKTIPQYLRFALDLAARLPEIVLKASSLAPGVIARNLDSAGRDIGPAISDKRVEYFFQADSVIAKNHLGRGHITALQ